MKVAIANVADSRQDFFEKRKELAEEEIKSLDWLRHEFDCMESGIIQTAQDVFDFAVNVRLSEADSLIIHIPIWADPILTIKLFNYINIPILLLGNSRPETSSIVGLLGAGGALDQVGCEHIRVFDSTDSTERKQVIAFVRAASTINMLKGQTLGRFGGRSLGIVTADVDAAQWQRIFGIDIVDIDQLEIVKEAEALDSKEVELHTKWLLENIGGVEYDDVFTPKTLEKQVRSYIATSKLVKKYKLDFTGVKCQPELSDGYVTQCIAHMLMNASFDANGEKEPFVHACESDANAALSMQILKLLSGKKAASLLDVRWFNKESGLWTLANCGAITLDFFATKEDTSGLLGIKMTRHIFGKGGGCALSGVVKPQKVTLARLCRKKGEYWMAIVSGDVEKVSDEEMNKTTNVFPKAFVRTSAGIDFLNQFGSNHIHMVSGDFTEELVMFSKLLGIGYKIWN